MELKPLTAISPIDGRYRGKLEELTDYFSEYALIKYRVKYVCNDIYYAVLKHIGEGPVRCIFTHIPNIENESQLNKAVEALMPILQRIENTC